MKKFLIIVLAVLMVFALAACDGQDKKVESPGVITDLEVAETSERQYIEQLDFAEDEMVESPYYKRTADDAGESVYMVKRAADGEQVYMPVTETVIYTSNESECYYQEIDFTYKLDGVPMEKKQYQIYIKNVTEETDDAVKVLPGNDVGEDLMAAESKIPVM